MFDLLKFKPEFIRNSKWFIATRSRKICVLDKFAWDTKVNALKKSCRLFSNVEAGYITGNDDVVKSDNYI